MDELKAILHEGDPAATDPGLRPEDVEGMRRATLGALHDRPREGLGLLMFAVTAVSAVVVVAGIWLARPLSVERHDPPVEAAQQAVEPVHRQQLIFSAPGGTRVIWVFDRSPQEVNSE